MRGTLFKSALCIVVLAWSAWCLNAHAEVPASQPATDARHDAPHDAPKDAPKDAAARDAVRDYSQLMGTAGNSKSVIYLCDSSGSMLSVFGNLKQSLKKSVIALDPSEKFNVIFFSDDNAFPLFASEMKEATRGNKAQALEFIDNAVCTGGTQPIPAIKAAMEQKPELVYLVTDGFDAVPSLDGVIEAFKKGNPDGKMMVNCIFVESDADPALEKALKKIAEDSHGKYKKIEKADM